MLQNFKSNLFVKTYHICLGWRDESFPVGVDMIDSLKLIVSESVRLLIRSAVFLLSITVKWLPSTNITGTGETVYYEKKYNVSCSTKKLLKLFVHVNTTKTKL